MKVLSFELSGKTAFFKKPDVNTFMYFSYTHIHKVALLGMFGAILGLGGYKQQSKKDEFPEFYSKLSDLKIAIIPLNEKGIVNKKVQTFNNSTGFASNEAGGNLIVKEQWLEDVAWQILVLESENEYFETLADYMLKGKACYYPCLGKNDHMADINKVELLETDKYVDGKNIASLFVKDDFEVVRPVGAFLGNIGYWTYEEFLPTSLNVASNHYDLRRLKLTDAPLKMIGKDLVVYKVGDKNVQFI